MRRKTTHSKVIEVSGCVQQAASFRESLSTCVKITRVAKILQAFFD